VDADATQLPPVGTRQGYLALLIGYALVSLICSTFLTVFLNSEDYDGPDLSTQKMLLELLGWIVVYWVSSLVITSIGIYCLKPASVSLAAFTQQCLAKLLIYFVFFTLIATTSSALTVILIRPEKGSDVDHTTASRDIDVRTLLASLLFEVIVVAIIAFRHGCQVPSSMLYYYGVIFGIYFCTLVALDSFTLYCSADEGRIVLFWTLLFEAIILAVVEYRRRAAVVNSSVAYSALRSYEDA
jgi:Na+/H+-dicarboxylate symporter